MTKRYSFDVLADAFLDAGVSHIFSLIGQANLFPIIRAAEGGAQVHRARHESGAVAMATGYAFVTGDVGFATLSKGPSFVNGLAALTSAVRDRIPLVVYVGATPIDEPYNKQHIDQRALVAVTGARFVECLDPAELRAATEAAFRFAAEEERPVVLSVPYDVVEAPAVAQAPVSTASEPYERPVAGELDPAAVEEVANVLANTERPLILGGRGVVKANGRAVLEDLADAVHGLLATTFPASGLFAGNEHSVGLAGGYASPERQALIREADLVLAFGASLNKYTTNQLTLFEDAVVVHCDVDRAAIGRQHRADIALHADAVVAAKAILAAAQDKQLRGPGFRTPDVLERLRRPVQVAEDRSTEDGVDPRTLVWRLNDVLPWDRRVAMDVGYFGKFVGQTLAIDHPGQFYPIHGFVTLGLGVATALGLSVAAPDETAVAFVGDGGLLMGLTELETAGRLGRDVLIVVLNDRAYGAEVNNVRKFPVDIDTSLVEYEPTPFADVAESLGVRALTIRTRDDLDHLEAFVTRQTGPRLVDVHINPEVK